jgi:simple sugar transport system permease protein
MMTVVNGTCILITEARRFPDCPLRSFSSEVALCWEFQCLFLVGAMILALLLRPATFGFNLFILGRNPIATRFGGIDNARTVLFAYLLSSVFASIVGLIMMTWFNSAKADYGQSYLLISVLAAVLGGTNASRVYGKVAGVVLAVIMLQIIASGFNLLGMDPFFCHHDGGDSPAGDDHQSFS